MLLAPHAVDVEACVWMQDSRAKGEKLNNGNSRFGVSLKRRGIIAILTDAEWKIESNRAGKESCKKDLFAPLCHLECNWFLGLIFGIGFVMSYRERREQVEGSAVAALRQVWGRRTCVPEVDWFGFICKMRAISWDEWGDFLSAKQTETCPGRSGGTLNMWQTRWKKKGSELWFGMEARPSQWRSVSTW